MRSDRPPARPRAAAAVRAVLVARAELERAGMAPWTGPQPEMIAASLADAVLAANDVHGARAGLITQHDQMRWSDIAAVLDLLGAQVRDQGHLPELDLARPTRARRPHLPPLPASLGRTRRPHPPPPLPGGRRRRRRHLGPASCSGPPGRPGPRPDADPP
ncbi:MAG: hypothetical protein ACRC35_03165 [Angustibacter sp.]